MAKDNPGVGERIVDGPEVWAQLLGGNAPALKYSDGEFIPAVNTEQQDTIDGNARKVD